MDLKHPNTFIWVNKFRTREFGIILYKETHWAHLVDAREINKQFWIKHLS